MLVLSFRVGEGAYLGRKSHVVLRSIKGNQIQLAFECDESIIVSRDKFSLETHLERQRARTEQLNAAKEASDGV